MSTSLHAVVYVVSGHMDFVIVFFNIRGRKMRISESSQNSISEKSIFGHFEVFFLNVWFFPRAMWLFHVGIFKDKYFNENMSYLDCLKEMLFIFSQKYWFWPSLTTWVYL